MGKRLRREKPSTVEELKEKIEKIWYDEISIEFIENLYQSMPRRIAAVIKAKGGASKY